jgi:N4-(beta-N-acetylglucosaminyl)-L-asparaginase
MRNGSSPEAACKKAVERIVARKKEGARDIQVGFIALNKKGQYGGYAIGPGFTYAVKSAREDRIREAPHHFQ